MTEPALGWALLSRDALRRAEEHLREETQGVRDEIGFLALHQAYADRFFPGTSVLQTRIRYLLFVPWIYQRIAQRTDRRRVNRILQQEEVELAGRLKETYGMAQGVIGSRSYPQPTSQPPSTVYWTALSTWSILRPLADGSCPSRRSLHRMLAQSTAASRLQDDDEHPLEEGRTFFVSLPEPPDCWESRRTPLTFNLTQEESRFLRRHLASVDRPGQLDGLCLLSQLVEQRVPIMGETLCSPSVLDTADEEDRDALLRAQQAAALAAVGRAVYAALVERACEIEDKREMPTIHRDHLTGTIEKYGSDALTLEIDSLQQDAPSELPQGILEILHETQRWLRQGGDYAQLYRPYARAEQRRKGRRARLAKTLFGRERRAEWISEEHPLADPLHYRWGNVQRLLADL